jgi:hypothetical protein
MAESNAALARKRFVRDTCDHKMQVFHDEGLYRHLRFVDPSSSMYWFDLVTWPGYLAIVGDAGDYVFCRTRDMFEFFESDFEDCRWGINPHYWGEKLQHGGSGGRSSAMSYSHEAFGAHLREWAREEALHNYDMEMYPSLLTGAIERELLSEYTWSKEEALERLRDMEDELGESPWPDAWEWDLREFDGQFLWCCWAIVWGIGQYRRALALAEAV